MNIRSKKKREKSRRGEHGFTLIETTIGLVVMMVVTLGSATLFAYAVRNNSGGNDRAQSLAIAQQALETLRNARYTVTVMDPILQQTTATPPPQTVRREGRPYTLTARIDDMPPPGSTVPTMKIITVTVTPQRASSFWSGGSVAIVTQRARSDQP
ncbi:MAG: prepilin-type N-terminal cleavage/methylation domain-containing protein [Acidobacteria bacterium]|nr:prepilin-type N-terminal cleavage/methylation domain-containing protein [Acidobacteriota bacterium]